MHTYHSQESIILISEYANAQVLPELSVNIQCPDALPISFFSLPSVIHRPSLLLLYLTSLTFPSQSVLAFPFASLFQRGLGYNARGKYGILCAKGLQVSFTAFWTQKSVSDSFDCPCFNL